MSDTAQSTIKETIEKNDVVLFMKGTSSMPQCGFSSRIAGVLNLLNISWLDINVLADETRPFLQGARLTVWELMEDNIPVKLITDNMSGFFMKNKDIISPIIPRFSA